MKPSEAIEKLLSSGMTEAAIGDAVSVRQSTINKIKRGVVPNWELGKRLVDLAETLPADEADLARRTPAANEGDAASETDGASAPLKAA